jgi:hypothetical protein
MKGKTLRGRSGIRPLLWHVLSCTYLKMEKGRSSNVGVEFRVLVTLFEEATIDPKDGVVLGDIGRNAKPTLIARLSPIHA